MTRFISENPLVSVIMPVYNASEYIREAIQSILDQTFNCFEFIIVNDGSNDDSVSIISDYNDSRIILLTQQNEGLAKALNAGLSKAKGKYIARMDADDISFPKRLQIQFDYLEANKECVVVGSNTELIDRFGNFLYYSRQPLGDDEIRNVLPGTPFFHSSTMFRRKEAIVIGGYSIVNRHLFEDVILWNKFSKIGKLNNLPEVLLKYRISPFNYSNFNISLREKIFELSIRASNNLPISEKEFANLNIKKQRKRSKSYILGNYYFFLGKIYLERNFNRNKAIFNFCCSLVFYPFNPKAHFNLLLSILPKKFIMGWKEKKGIIY